MTIEKRSFKSEFKTADKDGIVKVEGYAAIFNSPSDSGGLAFFVEVIRKGAFAKAIEKDDVRALYNHDENMVLGRNRANTLELSEDDSGLYYRVTMPKTTFALDLIESMKRGDINQSSFSFVPRDRVEPFLDDGKKAPDGERWNFESEPVSREILEVKLYDVSPVSYPWYEDTTSNVKESVQEVFANARKIYAAVPVENIATGEAEARHRRLEILQKSIRF